MMIKIKNIVADSVQVIDCSRLLKFNPLQERRNSAPEVLINDKYESNFEIIKIENDDIKEDFSDTDSIPPPIPQELQLSFDSFSSSASSFESTNEEEIQAKSEKELFSSIKITSSKELDSGPFSRSSSVNPSLNEKKHYFNAISSSGWMVT